jgi:hypothetical protein
MGTLLSESTTINTQDEYLELEFPSSIKCLYRLYRIKARKELLLPTKKWWIVDLYLLGISYKLKTILIKEYANKKKPYNSKIYYKICKYQSLLGKVNSKVSPTTYVSFEMR